MRSFSLAAAAFLTIGSQHVAAAASPVFLFTTFSASSASLRDEFIASMDNISHWSCSNEAGVSKHAIFVPRNASDTLTAYSIEQYDDNEALQKHLANDMVTSAHNASKVTSSVQNLTLPANSNNFFRTDLFAKVADPYVVIETLTYSNVGGMHHVIEHWQEAVEYSQTNETGTLALGIYTDPSNNKRLWTLAAYESQAYFRDVHNQSDMAKELEEHTGGMRTSRKEILLQKKGGFLSRGAAGGCV